MVISQYRTGHTVLPSVPRNGHTPEVPTEPEASIKDLTAQAVQQIGRIARDEAMLAALETRSQAKRLGVPAAVAALAGVFGLVALLAGTAAAIVGLSNVMRPWAAALTVMVAAGLLAGLCLVPLALKLWVRPPEFPKDRVESLKQDVHAVRDGLHR